MKKISYLLILLIFLINNVACTGYKPIFISSNTNFNIEDYSILGDKKLGNQIYSKIYNLSRLSENNHETKNINIQIYSSQSKKATAKNSAGKILGYRIILTSTISIDDYITEKEILSDTFSFSSTYKIQDQFSETIRLENTIIENLIEKTYQEFLIIFSENLL